MEITKRIKKSMQKIFAVNLCTIMAFANGSLMQAAAVKRQQETPKKVFATAADLQRSDIFSLSEANENKVGRINFGKRPRLIKYYEDDQTQEVEEGSPITWLIAGKDTGVNSNEDNNIVLYSEEPLLTASELDEHAPDSRFQTFANNINYDPNKHGTYDYSPGSGSEIYSNHWGASNLRTQAQNIYNAEDDEAYFSDLEKSLIKSSSIKTWDTHHNRDYRTDDRLYAANTASNDKIGVGSKNDISIDKAWWSGRSWLRAASTNSRDNAQYAEPRQNVNSYHVSDHRPAGSFAFKLDLSSVVFATAAAISDGSFSKIDSNTPMTLRLGGQGHDKPLAATQVSVSGRHVTVKNAPAKSRLMVLATGDNGTNYQYSKEYQHATDNDSVNISEINGLPKDMEFNARAWVETNISDTDTIVYATGDVDLNFNPQEPEASVTLNPESLHLLLGHTGVLTATVTPSHLLQQLSWDSSNTGVATVEQDGTVTAVGLGTAKITVTAMLNNGESKIATCIVTVTHDTSSWGTPVQVPGGNIMYVSDDGTTSTEVNNNGIIWLREESGGKNTWFGLDNSSGVFKHGSRFWVRWLNEAENPTEWQEQWTQLDDEHKNLIENNRIYIFQTGVTAPDGQVYTNFANPVQFYVQLNENWDKEDLQALNIRMANDDGINITYVDNFGYPEGTASFGVMTLNHFSPYAIYDRRTAGDENGDAGTDTAPGAGTGNGSAGNGSAGSGTGNAGNGNGSNGSRPQGGSSNNMQNVQTGDPIDASVIFGLGTISIASLWAIIKIYADKKKYN